MRLTSTFLLATIILLSALSATTLSAGDIKVEPDQRYLLLAASKASTMQEELDQAVNLGFCVRASTGMKEIAFFMERARPDEICRYLLIATNKTGTMQEELDDAAVEGWRFVPGSLMVHQEGFRPEIVVLLDKSSQGEYEYRFLATSRTGTLQEEVTQSVDEGFELVDLVTFGEHHALLEKPRQ